MSKRIAFIAFCLFVSFVCCYAQSDEENIFDDGNEEEVSYYYGLQRLDCMSIVRYVISSRLSSKFNYYTTHQQKK